MRILISNDDGVHAHGLRALVHAVAPLGEVTVIVPDRPRSACSHSVTLHKPLRVEEVALDGQHTALTCSGTPSDCVALGIEAIMPVRPDVVISGINLGPNIGDDVSYSGTIAAAMEAAIFGLKSIAISVCGSEGVDFAYAAQLARQTAELLLATDFPPETILNLNVPNLPADEIVGLEITRQGRRRWRDQFEKRADMRGGHYYWRGGVPEDDPDEPGTDVWAIHHKRVSITPLSLQWSHGAGMAAIEDLVKRLRRDRGA